MSAEFPQEKPRYASVPLGPGALLRLLLRPPLLVLATLVMASAWGLAALWPWSHARRVALRRGVSQRWAALICRILGARIELSGELPRGPGFLISNHVSYLDIPVLMSLTGCRFVSKHEVADWPLIGFLAQRAGTLFVKRGNGAREAGVTLEGMAQALADGDLVVFFPEGTTSPGERILPFRSGLLSLPARDGHAVYPAALRYHTHDPDVDPSLALAWSGKQSLLSHTWRLFALPGFTVRVGACQAIGAQHRKILAQALQHRVATLYQSLDQRLPQAGREAA